jgi:hypothetical protein
MVSKLAGGSAPHVCSIWSQGRFTQWPKVERPSISTNHIARNQEFGLSTLHTMVKVQRPSQFQMITFWRRRRTLEGSLGRKGMETQSMVERPSVFSLKIWSLTRSWPLDWRGYFEQGIKWDAPLGLDFGLGLWRLHTMAVQVERLWEFMAKGLDLAFGGFTLCPPEGSSYYILLVIFNSFLWTLIKVWPLNLTASRLGRPECEAALSVAHIIFHQPLWLSCNHWVAIIESNVDHLVLCGKPWRPF